LKLGQRLEDLIHRRAAERAVADERAMMDRLDQALAETQVAEKAPPETRLAITTADPWKNRPPAKGAANVQAGDDLTAQEFVTATLALAIARQRHESKRAAGAASVIATRPEQETTESGRVVAAMDEEAARRTLEIQRLVTGWSARAQPRKRRLWAAWRWNH
jgi:hypothetical protein